MFSFLKISLLKIKRSPTRKLDVGGRSQLYGGKKTDWHWPFRLSRLYVLGRGRCEWLKAALWGGATCGEFGLPKINCSIMQAL